MADLKFDYVIDTGSIDTVMKKADLLIEKLEEANALIRELASGEVEITVKLKDVKEKDEKSSFCAVKLFLKR